MGRAAVHAKATMLMEGLLVVAVLLAATALGLQVYELLQARGLEVSKLLQFNWRRWLIQRLEQEAAPSTTRPVPARTKAREGRSLGVVAKSGGSVAAATACPGAGPGSAAVPSSSLAGSADPIAKVKGAAAGHLRVLDGRELLQVTGAAALIDHMAQHSRLARSIFDRDLMPALLQYAEFVQLLPASESHHHANVGGLIAHGFETTLHALVLRVGYLLPRNGGAEQVDAQRDYWTYAIFLGALLHDVGKPLTDLRIEMRVPCAGAAGQRWMPAAGSMLACGGQEYKVGFTPKAERDYAAHGKLGAMLLQRLVPASALTFLGRAPDVLQELMQYLGGDARSGAIAEVVGKADQRSTAANLANGSRARFDTARTAPLVELLMRGLQDMLRQGSYLPLNRDGAAGWVFDGSVWFVAKRLADEVRKFVVSQAGEDAGVPGESKNDRLFDTWAEYRQLMNNPSTGKAIWKVRVIGQDGDGYQHDFSVLRFELTKLYPSGPDTYPAAMNGRIEVLERKADAQGEGAGAQAASGEGEGDGEAAGAASALQQPASVKPRAAAGTSAAPGLEPAEGNAGGPGAVAMPNPSAAGAVIQPAPVEASRDEKMAMSPAGERAEIPWPRPSQTGPGNQGDKPTRPVRGGPVAPSAATVGRQSDVLPEDESAIGAARASRAAEAAQRAARRAHARPASDSAGDDTPYAVPGARASASSPARPRQAGQSAPFVDGSDDGEIEGEGEAMADSPPGEVSSGAAPAASDSAGSQTLRRAVLHQDSGPIVARSAAAKEPTEVAIGFMRWLQAGLADGTLKYNEAGALVHFVEAGLGLVSPAIFREYAIHHGEPEPTPGSAAAKAEGAERVGLGIQREVLRAGWHVPSPADKTNIWRFQVSRRGGTKFSTLSLVVLADARRWVVEPPPPNPTLQLPTAVESAATP